MLNVFEAMSKFSIAQLHFGGGGGPWTFLLIALLFYWLVRSPCKNLKSYDNPFGGFEQTTGRREERGGENNA